MQGWCVFKSGKTASPEAKLPGVERTRIPMNSGNQDDRACPKPGFQFTEGEMVRLRRGDAEAAEGVATAIVRQFDSWMRAIRARAGWMVCQEDCRDIVYDFRAAKLEGIIAKYRNLPARHFTAVFYNSLKNHAVDWLRKNGRCIPVSNLPSVGGDGGEEAGREGFLERLPSETEDFRDRLTEEEMGSLMGEVRAFIGRWAEDPLQRWVLEAALCGERTAVEISERVGVEFPGKVYAVGSVYSLLSRFRADPGLRRIRNRYF